MVFPPWGGRWPNYHRKPGKANKGSTRDWNVPLAAVPLTSGFEPLFDFTFTISPETGYGGLNTTDEGNGEFLATNGSLTVTGGNDIGTYPFYLGGPGVTISPAGAFDYDNVLFPYYPTANPPLDMDGLLFTGPGLEINIWGNGAGNYSYYDYSGGGYGTQLTEDGTFNLYEAPGGGPDLPCQICV